MDEATAAIDSYTELLLFNTLKEYILEHQATMLMICHRLHGVNHICNKVMLLIYNIYYSISLITLYYKVYC